MKHIKIRFFFIWLLVGVLFSCQNKGEKVLSFYSKHTADSLKYKAACFLIENMPYYSFYEGDLLDSYLTYPEELRKNKFTALSPQEIADEIVSSYGPFSYDKTMLKKDILTIDSAYLCNNIEWAFKVWKEQPWGKNITFDNFCEYILPYRVGNEKLEYWRGKYYEKYNKILVLRKF